MLMTTRSIASCACDFGHILSKCEIHLKCVMPHRNSFFTFLAVCECLLLCPFNSEFVIYDTVNKVTINLQSTRSTERKRNNFTLIGKTYICFVVSFLVIFYFKVESMCGVVVTKPPEVSAKPTEDGSRLLRVT